MKLQLTGSNSNSEGSSEFVRIAESSNYTGFHQNFKLRYHTCSGRARIQEQPGYREW